METVRQDIRLAFRQLVQRPAFTAAAVLTLAIGMAVNTVAFSIVNALLLKRSAVGDRTDVGRILVAGGVEDEGNGSLIEFERYRDAARGALTVAAEARLAVAWRHDNITETAWALFVSDQYFSMVDVPMHTGRLDVTRGQDGTIAVAIGERFWRERLQARPLTGLTLRLNNVEVSVAGVIADSFRGPSGLYAPEIWIPLEERDAFGLAATFAPGEARLLFLMARLEPGVGVAEAQARVDVAAADMAREWPDTHRTRAARFRSFREGNAELRGLRPIAMILMAIIGLVLLLACFNVANMLLARAVEREREIGIRAALGAEARRLTRMMITEGLVLAGLAGVLTMVVAGWAQSLVGAFAIPVPSPQRLDLSPDWTVAAFIGALVVLAGVVPGLWPAFASARVNVVQALGTQGGGLVSGRPSAVRRWLVIAQIAGSTAFLVVAGLCVQLYASASAADLGFERERLVIAGIEPSLQGYDRTRTAVYLQRLVDRARALPGVVDAAVADRVPFYIGYPRTTAVAPAGGTCVPAACPQVRTFAIAPGLFRTMGRPIRVGREFNDTSAASAEIVVNEAFARQRWPDGGGVGDTVRLEPGSTPHVVVGIVADTSQRPLVVASSGQTSGQERPSLFLPLAGPDLDRDLTLVLRTAGPAAAAVRPLVDAAADVDGNIPLLYVQTMAQRMEVPLWPFKTLRGLFSICGVLALVLATVGLAGVVSHAVSRRLREFGVRLSIGATPRNLASEVIRGTAAMLLPGLVLGVILAAAAAQAGSRIFGGLERWDAAIYGAVALLETVIVLLACLAPALKAARVDPLVSLR